MINIRLSKPSTMILCLALLATLYGCAQAPKELTSAVQSGNAEQVNKLLTQFNINAAGPYGRTSLHEAVLKGDIGMTELLIAKGADVNTKDDLGLTPLYEAILRGNRGITELLIAKGADVNAQKWGHEAPLHLAVSRDDKDIAELLIDKGANVNARLGGFGKYYYHTPLSKAVLQGNKDMAELLIAKGANINAKYASGGTLLHLAAEQGRKEAAGFLLGKGADINAKDFNDSTPLHLAVKAGYKETTELLIGNGSDVNAKDQYGSTPLHIAFEQGNKDIAELLMSKGADDNIKNISGTTPTSVTAKQRKETIAANHGFYGYLGYGMTMYSDAPADSATGFPFGAGYRFNRHFSIEVGLFDSDSGDGSGSNMLSLFSGGSSESKSISSSTQYFAVVGALPLNDRAEVFGKLGKATTSLSYSSTITPCFLWICGQPQTVSSSASQTNTMYGIGWQWRSELSQNLYFRAQYENFGSVKMTIPAYNALATTSDIGISAISIGAFYNF